MSEKAVGSTSALLGGEILVRRQKVVPRCCWALVSGIFVLLLLRHRCLVSVVHLVTTRTRQTNLKTTFYMLTGLIYLHITCSFFTYMEM